MPEGHIHLEPSALNQLIAERQELVITARDTPVVWKAFTNDPALVSMRPSAGVIPARGKASVYALLMSTTEKMASQIVAKPISDTELNSLSVLESLDMTAEARKLFSKVSDSLKSNHRITIAPVETPLSAEPEPLKPPPPTEELFAADADNPRRARMPCRSRSVPTNPEAPSCRCAAGIRGTVQYPKLVLWALYDVRLTLP